jgi:PAS domain S-box-containing protein
MFKDNAISKGKHTPVKYETTLNKNDGKIIIVEISAKDVLFENKEAIQLLIRDISEEKKAQIDLKESEERFRILSNASFEGVIIHEKFKIIDVNKAFIELTGYSRRELIGKNAFLLLPKESQEKVRKNVEINYAKPYEVTITKKDGTPLTTEMFGKQMPYKDRDVRVVSVRDVTQQKLAEKEKLQREKLQGVLELAGAACHELNQPLQAISGYAEIALMNLSGNEFLSESLEIITQQIERMSNITSKLQNITQYETKSYLDGKIIDIDKASKKNK